MISSPPNERNTSLHKGPSFSFRHLFVLLSLLGSLVAWLALLLPWSTNGKINGMGTLVGTSALHWSVTGWSFAVLILLGLTVICSLLWLWHPMRVASLLLWGGAKVPLTIVIIVLVFAYTPMVSGPWVYACAWIATTLCDVPLHWHTSLPEILVTPHGEETLRPPR